MALESKLNFLSAWQPLIHLAENEKLELEFVTSSNDPSSAHTLQENKALLTSAVAMILLCNKPS